MTGNGATLRFHTNHANNVTLEENRLVAYRTAGYGGIVFSERFLHPGEFFVVEIEQNDPDDDWQGYLRLGLTQVHPSHYSSSDPVSRQELFNLERLGSTWMFALTELFLNLDDCKEFAWPYVVDANKVSVCENHVRTCCGSYSRVPLSHTPEQQGDPNRLSNLRVGFKLGVVYIPNDENFAELFYVVNGNVFGPYATDIPYKKSPLFAVADVYGRTKKIRVLPLRFERTLKQLCRMTILKSYDMQKVNDLHLPKSIMDYLKFNSVASII